jgi:hypothetical protein
MHNAMAVAEALPNLGNTVHNTADGRLVTATALLTSALVAPYSSGPADEAVIELLLSAIRLAIKRTPESLLYHKLTLSLIITAIEVGALSYTTLQVMREMPLQDIFYAVHDSQLEYLRNRFMDLLPADRPVTEPTALPSTEPTPLPATEPTPPTSAASVPPGPSPATSSPATPATPPAAP